MSGNPSGSSLSDDVFTWAPGVDDAGTYTVTFSVSDGSGGSASEQIYITVLDVPDNSNPTLASIGDQSVAEGSILSFTLSGSDADADELTYTVSGNPSGSSLSDDVFTWTPGVDDAGTYTVTFSVSDGNGGSDTEEISISVSDTPAANSDPILARIGDQSVAEGSILSFTLSGSDVDGDDLGFAVSGNPSGSSLLDDAFTWTPGYEDAGTYTVTFSVSDGNGGSDTKEISITVSETCNEPTCYRGDISITVSGKTCQKWTAQSPHEHQWTPENFPDSGLGDHNYCRSATETYAWCYTTDPSTRYEECDVVK